MGDAFKSVSAALRTGILFYGTKQSNVKQLNIVFFFSEAGKKKKKKKMASLAVDVQNSSTSSMEEDERLSEEEEVVVEADGGESELGRETEQEVEGQGEVSGELSKGEVEDEEEEEDQLPNISELKDICRGLMSHFDRNEDIDMVRQIVDTSRSTRAAVERAERGPKQTIRALTSENDELRENCQRQEPAEITQKRLQKLHQQKASEESELERMHAAEENALRSIQNLQERHAHATGEKTQILELASVEIPRVKYALSLYANISNIVWDYSSENVKGMITSPVGEPTKSFNIDPGTATNFDITNQLWDLMDSS